VPARRRSARSRGRAPRSPFPKSNSGDNDAPVSGPRGRRCRTGTLPDERGCGLKFTFGVTSGQRPACGTSSKHAGVKPTPMLALVTLLRRRSRATTGGSTSVRQPIASIRTARGWRPLRVLYSQAEIDRMRRSDQGYLGYRVGIVPAGNWLYFTRRRPTSGSDDRERSVRMIVGCAHSARYLEEVVRGAAE
jgi:hypothetical protein